jgi:predicted MFS family arabinose efflux permease
LLGAIEWVALPMTFIALFYILGYLTFSITLPLCNSLCAYYTGIGSRVNYGVGSGVGSIAFSFGSLSFGYIIAQLGMRAMIFVVLLFLIIQLVLFLCYPKVRPELEMNASQHQDDSISFFAFMRRYKFYMLTMAGVVCIAACHAMAENFLIHIFNRIGGGSEHVGITLFLACITAAPAQLYFERIQRQISIVVLLRICGLFYIAKAILLIFATTITSVYLIGLLQTFTYGFLYPPLYYLALQRIAPADMAKGQTLGSAVFSLGMAFGNSLGGFAVEQMGLNAMLAIAAGMALAGTLLINTTITRKDALI